MALAYILTISVSLLFLLLAAISSSLIKYEGGAKPRDAAKRRLWFWSMAIIGAAVAFLVGFFLLAPDMKRVERDAFLDALPIGTGIGFALYVVLGFILSRMFRNGKLGHWF